MKPVNTGAFWRESRLVSEDALQLWQAGSVAVSYEQINPFVFEPPASPRMAGCA